MRQNKPAKLLTENTKNLLLRKDLKEKIVYRLPAQLLTEAVHHA